MIARLYAFAAAASAPVLRMWLRRRLARGKEVTARLPERWGEDAAARPPGSLLWMHAASLGEAVSVLPVLPVLAERTDLSVLLTTGTVTSAGLLARRLPELGLAGRVTHRFVPLDVPAWAARFLAHWRPDAACFVEQEVWPNLLAGLRRRGVPVLLLNARLSARSAARWRLLGGAARDVFGTFATILAQSPADAARLAALGGRVSGTLGNLKHAAPPLPADAAQVDRLRSLLAGRPVWLAASTHPGEVEPVLRAHAALAANHPGLLTIVVPRHPGRGAEVARRARSAWPVTRRADRADPPAAAGVWVGDTVGELGLFYRLAPIVFVGGSLVAHGGQNPLEAARLGCAVAIGPHTANFTDIVARLDAAGALARVADPAALAAWVDRMLRDPLARTAQAAAAREAARPDETLPRRVAEAILALMPEKAA